MSDLASAEQGATIRISAVIPTLNEARNIGHVLQGMPDVVDELIIVDGSSVDGTVEAARAVRPDLVVVEQARRGKGNALAAGILLPEGSTSSCSTPTARWTPRRSTASSRRSRRGGVRQGKPVPPPRGERRHHPDAAARERRPQRADEHSLRDPVHRSVLRLQRLPPGVRARVRPARPAPVLPDRAVGDGFEVETLINIRAAKARLAIVEVPSYEHRRRHGQSNLNTFRDGFRVLRTIVRERVGRPVPAAPELPGSSHEARVPEQRAEGPTQAQVA